MSKSNKDPAILYYPKDWLAETHFLSFEEQGKLAHLRALLFIHGRLSSEKVVKAIGDLPEALNDLIEKDQKELYYCPKVEEEIRKRKAFKESRSNDGVKGNRVKEVMKERNVTKEEARKILEQEEGLVFGQKKYTGSVTPSVRNKGNAIGNENAIGDDSQINLLKINDKIRNGITLTNGEKEIMVSNRLNVMT